MIRTLDIAWLAGLLEGEGSLRLFQGKYPQIALGMTDGDIVRRAATLLGNQTYRYEPRGPRRKAVWRTQITGNRAASWMMTLFQFLGERKQSVVRKALVVWREAKNTRPTGVRDSWTRRRERFGASGGNLVGLEMSAVARRTWETRRRRYGPTGRKVT